MITQRQPDSLSSAVIDTEQKFIAETTADESAPAMGCIAEEQHYRSSMYKALASLLRTAPDNDVLQQVAIFSAIEQDVDEMALAMSTLGLSAQANDADAVDDEFHALFVGLGRGELMPYASWYLTGFLMEKPLSSLRDDLAALGFARSDSVHEPEDHIAALCEVMAMMIDENLSLQQQSEFFSKHMSNWQENFFSDLSQAEAAVFYRSVGRLGQAFSAFEKQYLSMPV